MSLTDFTPLLVLVILAAVVFMAMGLEGLTKAVRPAPRRNPVATRPHRSHGNGEWIQLIFAIPASILAVYITIKIISFFL